jgi:hypothetical protein
VDPEILKEMAAKIVILTVYDQVVKVGEGLDGTRVCALKYLSCRIFEHFTILPDPITEFIKRRSALHKQYAILAPKLADPLSLLSIQIHPFYLDSVFSQTWIQQPGSRSMQYLYYINMLVRLK